MNPASGLVVNVTVIPPENCALQIGSHEIPAGVEVTEPVPVPVLLTVTVNVGGGNMLKVAVTVRSLDAIQGPVPEQPPDQPTNIDPGPAETKRFTVVP
jgi:hypothetical protein